MTRLKQAWLALFKRYRMRKTFRAMANAWRETTGGSCRYKFHLGGSYMAFSAPEVVDAASAAKILREVANIVEALDRGDFEEIGDGE
jgi:hypothetical protein